jgi:integrase/recombinase XerD
MSSEIVPIAAQPLALAAPSSPLPVLVERAGGAGRFAWEEFFYAQHHNRHTQRAYERAVRRFLGWCEG